MKIMISFQVDTSDEAQAVIAAVAGIGKEPHACSKQYVDPAAEFSDRRVMHGRRAGEVEDEAPAPASNARANVSPGTPSIGKIGSNTSSDIQDLMLKGAPIPAKYKEHMKLLWARGHIKFDGKDYYI